jgi:hypothetical protein
MRSRLWPPLHEAPPKKGAMADQVVKGSDLSPLFPPEPQPVQSFISHPSSRTYRLVPKITSASCSEVRSKPNCQ